MSWRIWISQDTRVKQKVISAPLQDLNLVESSVNKYLLILTISRGENWREVWIRPCRRFAQHEDFSKSRPLTDFTSFLVSRLVSGFITLFSQALAFYHVSHVNHTSEQHLNDLGSHFLKTAFGPSVWIQIHIIAFTKLGATAPYHVVFATPVRRSFDTPAYRGQLLVEPTESRELRGPYCFCVCISRSRDKDIKIQILRRTYA